MRQLDNNRHAKLLISHDTTKHFSEKSTLSHPILLEKERNYARNLIPISKSSQITIGNKKNRQALEVLVYWWALTDSNRRPSACKADALNQLS